MRKAPSLRPLAMAGALFLSTLAASTAGFAQALKHVQDTASPLVLKSRGSFIVGGESVMRTPEQLSTIFDRSLDFGGHITVHHMYVEFMVPAEVTGVPVVMLHGATLSGKTYDTTPDGRMGWYEYFVRRGHPTYVPDQVSRGRSDSIPLPSMTSGRAQSRRTNCPTSSSRATLHAHTIGETAPA